MTANEFITECEDNGWTLQMTPYEFIKKCEGNGWTLRIICGKPWRIEIEGEPADKVNEAMEILRQDMEFEARVFLALAHYHAFYNENSILWGLITNKQIFRAVNHYSIDPFAIILTEMGYFENDSK